MMINIFKVYSYANDLFFTIVDYRSFIFVIITLAIFATIRDYRHRTVHGHPPTDRVQYFSIIENTYDISQPKDITSTVLIVDIFKIIMILCGVAGHALTCLESVPGWWVVHRLTYVQSLFRQWYTQALFNEGGLGILTVTGGFVTYWSVAPLIKSGKFKYFKTIFDRWLKFVPIIMTMVGLEICWPLIGSGPLYQQVADHLLNKCTKTAWMNFLFVNNYEYATDSVSFSFVIMTLTNYLPTIIMRTTLVLLIN